MTVHAFPADPGAVRRTSRSRYPAGHAAPAAGTVDAVGNVHDIKGKFSGHYKREGGPEVINAADGTFYFPPMFNHATVEEYLDFWMNVSVPEDALARFVAAHSAAREEDPAPGEDYPEFIPLTWARHYARIASAAGLRHNLSEDEAERLMAQRVEVDYDPDGDTISGFVDRYRIRASVPALDYPDPEQDRLARLEQQLTELAASVGKVQKTVNYIEATVDDIDDGVDKVKDGLDDVEDEVQKVGATARMIDVTVAPKGTYSDGTRAYARRQRRESKP